MWKNIILISTGIYIWSCIGGFDWVSDSYNSIINEMLDNWVVLNHLQIDNVKILTDNVENILKTENEIKTYTLYEAKTLVLEAFKNKSWTNDHLTLDITLDEFKKNYIIFDEAYRIIFKLLKEEFLNQLKNAQ